MFLKEIKEHVTLFVLSAFYDTVISSIILSLLRIAAGTKKRKLKKALVTVKHYFMFCHLARSLKRKARLKYGRYRSLIVFCNQITS